MNSHRRRRWECIQEDFRVNLRCLISIWFTLSFTESSHPYRESIEGIFDTFYTFNKLPVKNTVTRIGSYKGTLQILHGTFGGFWGGSHFRAGVLQVYQLYFHIYSEIPFHGVSLDVWNVSFVFSGSFLCIVSEANNGISNNLKRGRKDCRKSRNRLGDPTLPTPLLQRPKKYIVHLSTMRRQGLFRKLRRVGKDCRKSRNRLGDPTLPTPLLQSH